MLVGASAASATLGVLWPGRIPGAEIAVVAMLVAAGAAIAGTMLGPARRAPGAALAAGSVWVAAALSVLAPLAWVVRSRFDLREQATALREIRRTVVSVGVDPVPSSSPVAWFWILAVLLLAGLVAAVLRSVRRGRGERVTVLVLVLATAVAAVAWLTDLHVLGRWWLVGVGMVAAVVPVPASGRPARLVARLSAAMLLVLVALGPDGRAGVVLGATLAVVLVVTMRDADPPAVVEPSALVAWAAFWWIAPLLAVAPAVIEREPGLRDRLALLAVAVLVGAVTVGVLALLRRRGGAVGPIVLLAASLVATVIVVRPALERVEAVEADVFRVERALLDEFPDCYGAATMLALLDGETCDNPELEGTINREPDSPVPDYEPFSECWSQPHETELNLCRRGGPEDAPRVLVLGDSHARVLIGAFDRLADHGVISLAAATKASCGWSARSIETPNDPSRSPACDRWRDGIATWLERHGDDVDLIVTTAYTRRMAGPRPEKVQGLVDVWEPVVRSGIPVIAITDNPSLPEDTDPCLARSDGQWSRCDVRRAELPRRFDAHRVAAARVDGAHLVDTRPMFCRRGVCPAVIGGVSVYRDHNHVSATYAATMAAFLHREILWTGVLHPAEE